MEIQFSFQAAQDACIQLEENSVDIEKKRQGIAQANDDMAKIWTGELSDTVLDQMKKYADWIVNVRQYLDYIDAHIESCRKNYDITEKTNTKILDGIDALFM